MVKIIGHKRVKDMPVFKKLHAIFHEVIDELAQSYLLGGFSL